MKLDFCPNCFDKIDENNLSYELIYASDWDEKRLENETYFGKMQTRSKIISTADSVKVTTTKGDTQTQERSIIRPGMMKNFVLQLNMKFVESSKSIFDDNDQDDVEQYGEKDSLVLEKKEEPQDDDKKKIIYEELNGEYSFFVVWPQTGKKARAGHIMKAIPCCPMCKRLLPESWLIADDFCAVTLIAPTSSGKTSFLYSIIGNNMKELKKIGTLNGVNIRVSRANSQSDIEFNEIMKKADAMCRDKGKCPENSPYAAIPAIYLLVTYGEHRFILGFYDNAGELLRIYDPDKYDFLDKLKSGMFADFHLFDPKYMSSMSTYSGAGATVRRRKEDYVLEDIEHQGIYQDSLNDRIIHAEDVLNEEIEVEEKDLDLAAIMETYESIMDARLRVGAETNKCFFGIVIKSDLLEKVEDIGEKYAPLFQRGNVDLLDETERMLREDMVKKMIFEHDMLDINSNDINAYFSKFEEDYGNASWYAISALGCDAIIAGNLLGKYNPILVAEPVAQCIKKYIIDKKWINKKAED